MAASAAISMVVSWVLIAGGLAASFIVRRLRTAWIRWLLLGLLVGNSGGLMDQVARDRNWPLHQQDVVSSITLTLSVVGLVLVLVAAWALLRRDVKARP